MQKYLLLLLLPFSLLHGMKEDTLSTQEITPLDTSIQAMPLARIITTLRLIILNRLQEKDYTNVTHLIEKTKLHPGEYFTNQFERDVLVGAQIYYKRGGIVYFLYKAAMEEGHKRLIRLIQDEGCLEQVSIYAGNSVFNDRPVKDHVQENPHSLEQYEKYVHRTNAFNNFLLIQDGKKPLSDEEWHESYQKAWDDYIAECKARREQR